MLLRAVRIEAVTMRESSLFSAIIATINSPGNMPALECVAKFASHANDFCGELNEPLF